MDINPVGLRQCALYAFPPNLFHYCGPEKQEDLLGYLRESVTDKGLVEIINHFETLYPYLVLIASENHIKDPFDQRVVEAYWLGNDLLKKVKLRSLVRHFEEVLEIKKKLPIKAVEHLFNGIDTGIPHHTYHVLNIFRRTGHIANLHTLKTMDNCRISWGKIIINQRSKIKDQRSKADNYLIRFKPSIISGNKLILGPSEIKTVINIKNSFEPGDWVSCHWGYVCEKVTRQQIKALDYYTQNAITAYNQYPLL